MRKKFFALALAALMLLTISYGAAAFTPNPQTEYARSFVALCEGEQWFIDEAERLLAAKMKSINTLRGKDDLSAITALACDEATENGSIPLAIGEFGRLRFLFLDNIGLGGAIPGALYTLSELENLDISGNNYAGTIPAGLGGLTKLKILSLAGNAFSGAVPSELTALTSLQALDISGNRFSGDVPAALAALQSGGTNVFAENNYLFGRNAAAITHNAGNFIYGEANQYRVYMPEAIELTKNASYNVYAAFETYDADANTAAAHDKLPVSRYDAAIVSTLANPEEYAKISRDAGGIYITLLKDIPEGEALEFELRMLPYDGEEQYSFARFGFTVKGQSAPGGSGGGASPEEAENAWNHEPYINGFDGGTFRPNDPVTREQLAAMTARILELDAAAPASAPFSDVAASRWSAGCIAAAKDRGFMFGENGVFRPADGMTRAELAAALVRIAEKLEMSAGGQSGTFIDVAQNAWYYEYISKAVAYGLIGGYADGTFRPNAKITRAEAVTMINRLLGRDPAEESLAGVASPFTDVQDAGYWAYMAILEASVGHEHKI